MRISVHIFFIFYFMANNIDIAMKEIIKDTRLRPAYLLSQLFFTNVGHLDIHNVPHVFVLVEIPGASS